MLSCRTKLEKLLCLKTVGRSSRANASGCRTMKASPSAVQLIKCAFAESSSSDHVCSMQALSACEQCCAVRPDMQGASACVPYLYDAKPGVLCEEVMPMVAAALR